MVYRVRKQLVEEGLEAVVSRKQRATPAVPPIFDGEKEAMPTGCPRAASCTHTQLPKADAQPLPSPGSTTGTMGVGQQPGGRRPGVPPGAPRRGSPPRLGHAAASKAPEATSGVEAATSPEPDGVLARVRGDAAVVREITLRLTEAAGAARRYRSDNANIPTALGD
jgi:hypothetical protein